MEASVTRWAYFYRSWQQICLQKKPKYWVPIVAICKVRTDEAAIWATFGETGHLFLPISVHTEVKIQTFTEITRNG